jgi:hypothetical protein
VVEHPGLAALSGFDKVVIEDGEDVFADLLELCLDLLAVSLDRTKPRRFRLGLPF